MAPSSVDYLCNGSEVKSLSKWDFNRVWDNTVPYIDRVDAKHLRGYYPTRHCSVDDQLRHGSIIIFLPHNLISSLFIFFASSFASLFSSIALVCSLSTLPLNVFSIVFAFFLLILKSSPGLSLVPRRSTSSKKREPSELKRLRLVRRSTCREEAPNAVRRGSFPKIPDPTSLSGRSTCREGAPNVVRAG